MSKKLDIGSIKLPVQAATKGFAFIGKRGSGKSYGAADLAEEFALVSVPFVVFDPIDVWWGLRLAADGKGKGLPVVVFGKEHADIQLTRGMGREIAHAVVRENVSCVISTFGMGKAEMREIIADFSETLLNINNTPRHVFIEEAHEYVPQRVMGATARCFSAVEALIVMGRNRGIGVSVMNQRMATINKDVVSQIDTLVAFRSVGPQDRKALRDWFNAHEHVYAEGEGESDFDKFIKSIPSMPTGEAWVWSPEFMQIFERVKFRKRRTFHPDREKIGSTFKMPTIAATDIQAFVDKFTTKGSAGTSKGGTGAKGAAPVAKTTQEKYAEQVKLDEIKKVAYDAGLTAGRKESKKQIDGLLGTLERIGRLVAGVPDLSPIQISGGHGGSVPPSAENRGGGGFAVDRSVITHPARASVAVGDGGAGGNGAEKPIQGGALRMLKVLVSKYPMEFTRPQLGTLADVKHSGGTYTTYLSLLKVKGLIEESGGKIRATQAGLDFLGEDVPRPQSPEETRDMWRGKLQGGARRMFEALEGVYPNGYSREDLGHYASVTHGGGTFTTYLSQLKSNGLAVEDGGIIKLSDILV